jgi:hypothetical protein
VKLSGMETCGSKPIRCVCDNNKRKENKWIEYPIMYWIRHNSCWSEYSSEFIYVDILGETL